MKDIRKELQALRALGAETVQRTSRLLAELTPVQGKAPSKKRDLAQERVDRYNRRIGNGRNRALHAAVLIIGLACLLFSCNPTRSMSAGCKNGYVGYGTPFHTDHGGKRQSY